MIVSGDRVENKEQEEASRFGSDKIKDGFTEEKRFFYV